MSRTTQSTVHHALAGLYTMVSPVLIYSVVVCTLPTMFSSVSCGNETVADSVPLSGQSYSNSSSWIDVTQPEEVSARCKVPPSLFSSADISLNSSLENVLKKPSESELCKVPMSSPPSDTSLNSSSVNVTSPDDNVLLPVHASANISEVSKHRESEPVNVPVSCHPTPTSLDAVTAFCKPFSSDHPTNDVDIESPLEGNTTPLYPEHCFSFPGETLHSSSSEQCPMPSPGNPVCTTHKVAFRRANAVAGIPTKPLPSVDTRTCILFYEGKHGIDYNTVIRGLEPRRRASTNCSRLTEHNGAWYVRIDVPNRKRECEYLRLVYQRTVHVGTMGKWTWAGAEDGKTYKFRDAPAKFKQYVRSLPLRISGLRYSGEVYYVYDRDNLVWRNISGRDQDDWDRISCLDDSGRWFMFPYFPQMSRFRQYMHRYVPVIQDQVKTDGRDYFVRNRNNHWKRVRFRGIRNDGRPSLWVITADGKWYKFRNATKEFQDYVEGLPILMNKLKADKNGTYYVYTAAKMWKRVVKRVVRNNKSMLCAMDEDGKFHSFVNSSFMVYFTQYLEKLPVA